MLSPRRAGTNASRHAARWRWQTRRVHARGPDGDARPGRAEMVRRLRAAGCVFAEEEAALLLERFPAAAEREPAVRRREQGMPLEHVLGSAEFDGVRVAVDPGVFVPRRRAEPLAGLAADALHAAAGPGCAVDLGCGSGAIAAAVAARAPGATVLAVDADPQAAACARRNAAGHGFSVYEGNWFEGLPGTCRGRVDVAVAYLPHVPTAYLDRIAADYRRAEPPATVHGGADGLDPMRAVLAQAPAWLRASGVVVTMSAAQQEAGVRALAAEGGWRVESSRHDDDVFYLLRRPPLSQGHL